MLHAAAAQKTKPSGQEEAVFSPAFYAPYALAVQKVFLLCCTLRDRERLFGRDPGVRTMTYRLKTPGSISDKLLQKGLPATRQAAGLALHDVSGLRVVLENTQQVYAFAALIVRSPQVALTSTRDYIKTPKPSGYRSLHLILTVRVVHMGRACDVPVEVQLRTAGMDAWASIEHDVVYKPTKVGP